MEYMLSIDIFGYMNKKCLIQPKLKICNYNLRYEKLLLCLRPDLS